MQANPQSKIFSDQKVLLVENIMMQDLAGESVLLNLENEEYFGLDLVAKEMLSSLTKESSIENAYVALLEKFDVEPEQLNRDLQNFILTMQKHELVEVVDI